MNTQLKSETRGSTIRNSFWNEISSSGIWLYQKKSYHFYNKILECMNIKSEWMFPILYCSFASSILSSQPHIWFSSDSELGNGLQKLIKKTCRHFKLHLSLVTFFSSSETYCLCNSKVEENQTWINTYKSRFVFFKHS